MAPADLDPYEPLLITSGERYLGYLRRLELEQASGSFKTALLALTSTLQRAIGARAKLDPADVSYYGGLYTALTDTGEWRYLANQWALGVGSRTPEVIAMGTEAAADPRKAGEAFASGGLILELSGGAPAIARAVGEGLPEEWTSAIKSLAGSEAIDSRRPDALLHAVGWQLSPRHTWSLLSSVLDIPGRDLGALFSRAYLIERSVLPAKRSSGGAPPTTERTAFLREVVMALSTARTLILYGATNHAAWSEDLAGGLWDWANREITKAFLGVERLDEPEALRPRDEKHAVAAFSHGGRQVLWTRALSGMNVTNAYLKTVRAGMGR